KSELSDRNLISHFQLLGVAWLAVDISAVERSHIDDLELVAINAEFRVTARNGDVIEEDICLGVATSGGRGLVEQEPRTSVRSTLDHEEGLSFRQVICARGGGISARSSGVLHFFEQVCTENRGGFNLGFWSAIVLGHDVYLRWVGQC